MTTTSEFQIRQTAERLRRSVEEWKDAPLEDEPMRRELVCEHVATATRLLHILSDERRMQEGGSSPEALAQGRERLFVRRETRR